MGETASGGAEGGLKDQRILVIGASSGIGRATARRLSELGATIVAVGRRRKLLDELVEEMGGGYAVEADLRDPDQCRSLVERGVEKVGTFDGMVFAASVSSLAMTADAQADIWRTCMETNVIAPVLVTSSLLPHLTPGGFLGYLSSEMVGQPYHGLTHYGSSKAALEEMIRGLRVEHPDYRFSCIRVGATGDTDFSRDFSPELAVELSRTWVDTGKIPANLMTSDELGTAIAGVVAIAFACPGVDVQDVSLRPPGGPMTGEMPDVAEQISELQSR